MDNSYHFRETENTEKIFMEITNKVQKSGARQLTYSLAAAIAVLSGSFIYSQPAQAKFNVPTDSTPSPLCVNGQCATDFSAKMLRFEEFGLRDMPSENSGSLPGSILPSAQDCQSSPDGQALDNFLKEQIHPFPTRKADESLTNFWEPKVKDCVGLAEVFPTVGDGRPGGEWFAHQRWDEFFPKKFFQSAMTGARVNGGLRDDYQMHHYNKGEFKPGGLYYMSDAAGNPGTADIDVKMHPNLPVQDPNSVWTFDGTFPPKLLMALYGEPILFRHYNALPIDISANNGFGTHTITTHEHNGHNPAESDGYAHAYSYPGEFYDYHWPMILAGHDSINIAALGKRAGTPDGNGGITPIPGDWRETMSTHWFHDHMLDFTAQNVYKGNAAMMNYYSAIDRGREPKNEGEAAGDSSKPGYGCHYANPDNVNLCLPSGSELDWGNRDYDVNLLVADKAWDNSGQLKFNIFNTDGFLGDRVTVNWFYKPYFEVRARRYRFRILNGSVSRYFKIAIVDEAGNKIPFHMIANDGNLMEHAIPFPNSQSPDALPEQGIAERYDIIVDFKGMAGKKLYMVNILEHQNGTGPSKEVPLADVLSGKYRPDGKNGDPAVGKFLEFRVQAYEGTDLSMNPADYEEGKKQMIPLNKPTVQELQEAVHRTFDFGRSDGTDSKPWTIKTDGGTGFNMDPHRLSAAPSLPDSANGLGKVEVWHIKLGGGGWSHPVHVHFEEGQVLYRGGKAPPIWEKYARKDVYRIGPLPDSTDSVDVAIRFREFAGTYMEHCHNTQHEDKAMLLRWDIENPNQTLALPTPMPEWDGVGYDDTVALPSYKTGDLDAKANFQLPGSTPIGVDAPLALDDSATAVAGGAAVSIPVTDNDSTDPTAPITSLLLVGQPDIGAAAIDGTSITYTPGTGTQDGVTTFQYTAFNSAGESNVATVTVTVTPSSSGTGSAPSANDDGPISVDVNQLAQIDVLSNDSVSGGAAIDPGSVTLTNVTGGTASVNTTTGVVTYTAGATAGDFGFDYTVANTDGMVSQPAHVTVTVVEPVTVETIQVTSAQCRSKTKDWKVTGTSTVQNNNSIQLYLNGSQLGGATPVVNGSWSFQLKKGPTCVSPISLTSTAGTTMDNIGVTLK